MRDHSSKPCVRNSTGVETGLRTCIPDLLISADYEFQMVSGWINEPNTIRRTIVCQTHLA